MEPLAMFRATQREDTSTVTVNDPAELRPIRPMRTPSRAPRGTGNTSCLNMWWRRRTRLQRELQPFHLAEGAGDADRAGPEVDGHRVGLLTHDATDAIRLVGHPVSEHELLDDWLGLRKEGTTGKMSPLGRHSFRHWFQYALSRRQRPHTPGIMDITPARRVSLSGDFIPAASASREIAVRRRCVGAEIRVPPP